MTFPEHLQALMPLQALVAALVLLTLIGWRGASAGGRWACAGMCTLALGLGLLSPATAPLPARWVQGAGLAVLSAGLTMLWQALSLWLRPPPRPQALPWAVLALPAAVALGRIGLDANPSWARAWVDAVLALQFALLAQTLTHPTRASVVQGLNTRRWRSLGLAAVSPLLLVNLWRAGAELLGWGPLASGDLLLALAVQLSLLLALPVLLLAWRSETEAELARLAQTDGLTGLIDQPAFTQRSIDMVSMARRYQEPLALVVLELDGFAELAQTRGLEAGDRALALFASGLQTQRRLGDLCGRLAGQRFGVLMARSEGDGPEAFDQRLRGALATRAVAELGFTLSYSAGWARLRVGDRNLADLLRRAETALYEARHAGTGVLMAEPGAAD